MSDSSDHDARSRAVGQPTKGLALAAVRWVLGRAHPLALAGVVLIGLLSYNATTIVTQGNGFKHPDETGTYVLGEKFLESGKFTYQSDLITRYGTEGFAPPGLPSENGRVEPFKAYGVYIFTAGGLLLGDAGPFVLVALAATAVGLLAYATVRVFAGASSALIAAAVIALSFPMIFWSQSLYGNVVALSLFAGAIYLLAGYVTLPSRAEHLVQAGYGGSVSWSYWRFAAVGLLLGLAASVRFEYVVFGGLLLLVLFLFRTLRLAELGIASCVFGLLVLWVLALNWQIFGSPFSIAQTQPSSSFAPASSGFPLEDIFNRFLRHDVNPDISRLWRNFKDWLWGFSPGLVVLGTTGMVLQLARRGRQLGLWAGLTVIGVLWSYDTLGGFHWGEGSGQRGAVYGRYLLPTFYVLGLSSPFALTAIARVTDHVGKKLSLGQKIPLGRLMVGALVALTLAVTPLLLLTGQGNLRDDIEIKRGYRELNADVSQLPQDAIVVANLHAKGITSRPVLAYYKIDGPPERGRSETVRVVHALLTDGRPVFLVETPWHRSTYLNIAGTLREYPQFELWNVTIGNTQMLEVTLRPPVSSPASGGS